MSNKHLNLLIVDDQKYHNSSMKVALSLHEGICVIGTAINDKEMYHILQTRPIDIILLDVELPRTKSKDGLQIAHELKAPNSRYKTIKIIALSMNTQSMVLRKLLIDIGIEGYLDKNQSEIDDIVNALKRVQLNGEIPVISENLRKKVQRLRLNRIELVGMETLSSREREILPLIAQGKANVEIAQILESNGGKGISEKTVGKHRENIYSKLDCSNSAQVAHHYFNRTRLHSDSDDELPSFKSF